MKRGKMIIVCGLLLLLNLYVLRVSCAEPSLFHVSCERTFVNYKENHFLADVPFAGTLTITISDNDNTYVTIIHPVETGRNVISWNGCAEHNEKLNNQVYHASCSLSSDQQSALYEFDFGIEYSAQALIYALPSSGSVYTDELSSWFMEYKTVFSGRICLEFYKSGDPTPSCTIVREVSGGRANSLNGKDIFRGECPPEGEYTVRVYEVSSPGYCSEFTLTVCSGKSPFYPLEPTGKIIPDRDDSDEMIWEMMVRPAAVIDIKPESHQSVYEEPDDSGRILGSLHGQTQSFEVMEISGEWVRISAWNHEEAEQIEGWIPRKNVITLLPNQEYGLLLDKEQQMMTVFHKGKRIGTVSISTGRMETNALFQETAAGSFLTGLHRVDFSTNGKRFDYVIQYDGGNLLHQIPYNWKNNRKDFRDGRSFLGTKASHACIRIQDMPGSGGINAYWIWTHIPFRTRLIILDDEEARHERIALMSHEPIRDASVSPVEWIDESDSLFCADSGAVILSFGGDAVLGARETYYGKQDSFPAYIGQHGYSYPFSGLASLFENDDITSVNLECVLQQNRDHEVTSKEWRFRGLPEYAEILQAGSVEVVNIANNHTIDYGPEGMESTIAALESKAGYFGNGHNIVIVSGEHRIGFGGCRETVYIEHPDTIRNDLAELKEMGADFIVYQCHWGKEYQPSRSNLQEAMARECVRNGADLVIGHHPHTVQGMDVIDGVPVVYSLGNLSFGGTLKLQTYEALVVQAAILFHGNGYDLELKLVPILTSGKSDQRINDYRPEPAGGETYNHILSSIQKDCPFLVSPVMRMKKPQ